MLLIGAGMARGLVSIGAVVACYGLALIVAGTRHLAPPPRPTTPDPAGGLSGRDGRRHGVASPIPATAIIAMTGSIDGESFGSNAFRFARVPSRRSPAGKAASGRFRSLYRAER